MAFPPTGGGGCGGTRRKRRRMTNTPPPPQSPKPFSLLPPSRVSGRVRPSVHSQAQPGQLERGRRELSLGWLENRYQRGKINRGKVFRRSLSRSSCPPSDQGPSITGCVDYFSASLREKIPVPTIALSLTP